MLSTQKYRRASVFEIAAGPSSSMDGRAVVEPITFLSPSVLDVPPIDFGNTDLTRDGIELQHKLDDPGESRLTRHSATPAFLLHNATVHGKYGVITLDDLVLEETLYHFPMHDVPGAAWEGGSELRLPQLPLSATAHSAYHLLACNLDNYFHWMIDLVTRFNASQYEAQRCDPESTETPLLLMPTLDTSWKRETIDLSVPRSVPRISLTAEARMFARRLLYVPDLSGGAFNPHPALLEAFDTIRARVLGDIPAPRPWRRLYVSRTDSRSRVLTNEAEVIEHAIQAGFTPVLLGNLSVRDQVRLFAEASHILAPHGAGLTNLGFCQPGAVLCELQMDSYVHWAFRVLAALRGVRYGCLIGTTVGERNSWAHSNAWRLDITVLDAVLNDPRFVGNSAAAGPADPH
jgi:capsular polysaccharide biosynthesis protein